jgi:cyanophycinase
MKKPTKNECPVPNGMLFIIGGAEEKLKDKESKKKDIIDLEVLKQFIGLVEKKNPLIEVITTASGEDVEETFKEYKHTFTSICSCTVNHINHQKREDIDELEIENRVKQADAIFFSGGDQLKLTSIYGGTQMMLLIKQRYINEKLVIAGTSAGAMALSTPMIFAGTGADEMVAAGVKITTGFEFLKDVCIDTHFVHRGRFVRMAQVIATNPSCIGVGIEEDTAILVKKGTQATVYGCGVIIIINGKNSKGNNITDFNEDKALSIRDLNVSILAKGEQFEIPQMNPPHQ